MRKRLAAFTVPTDDAGHCRWRYGEGNKVVSKQEFFSEEKLETFDGWLEYQGATGATGQERAEWQRLFDELKANPTPRVGLMKLRRVPGEYKYAVAIRDELNELWLTLWVRRSPKGEFFVMVPRGDRAWNPHCSYHLDGTFHSKSYGSKSPFVKKLQPLTSAFHGAAHLGYYGGHGTGTGAVCDPSFFDGIVELSKGILGPRDGSVVVDLVEPGCEPLKLYGTVVREEIFRDFTPWLIIRIELQQPFPG
jgi:hypothetical protein